MLIHDVGETVTGDIIRPFKTPEQVSIAYALVAPAQLASGLREQRDYCLDRLGAPAGA